MAAANHIPLEELSADTRALLEQARERGDLFIDGHGVHFKISRLPGRTAAEALEIMRNLPGANVEVDDEWSNDMSEIIALRRTETYRDPWE
jgi:hypothetical protein